MNKVNVRCEFDPALTQIEVLIRAPGESEALTELLEQFNGHPPDSITVTDNFDRLCVISAEDIVIASVKGKLVNIVTEKGSYLTRQPLQNLEAQLDPRSFVRISRYELVNLRKVLRYDFTVAGTLRIELAGGLDTWASRRCIPQIRERLLGKNKKGGADR